MKAKTDLDHELKMSFKIGCKGKKMQTIFSTILNYCLFISMQNNSYFFNIFFCFVLCISWKISNILLNIPTLHFKVVHLYLFNLHVHSANCTGTVKNIAEQMNQSPQELSHCCWWTTVVLCACSLTWLVCSFSSSCFQMSWLTVCWLCRLQQMERISTFYQWIFTKKCLHFVISVIVLFPASVAAFTQQMYQYFHVFF